MAARGGRGGRGLGLRIGVPSRLQTGRPQPLPVPQPLPLPLPPVVRGENNSSSGGANSALHFTPREDVNLEDLERLQPPLGFGSGGRVYKVRHKRTGKEYALKIIQEKHEEEVRKQIVREMQILRRARCPFIVDCYGIFDTMGEISFVLELMDGGTLADVVKAQGSIPEQYLAEISRHVLQGLQYLHREHVVHRDIKPSNLLINRDGQVKIADFGVSTMLANTLAQCTSYVGTSAYLSPERINPPAEGGGQYDGYASDVWSFGLTLLELSMGRFPYIQAGHSADWMTLFGAIVYNDPPQAPSGTSAEFRSFIAACLQKDVKARATVAALLEHPFCRMYTDVQYANLQALFKSK
eukprot:TRINITY_DN3250_c0_g1_i1.p1 TRINITY_DN3250_c0_g1~~TRINITY_DN3250_c0_g1_i1.p1  ORF type:complete len:353 (+),score=59.82 TRINITY_DN3250_c0_g1_i1:178-1236(+)